MFHQKVTLAVHNGQVNPSEGMRRPSVTFKIAEGFQFEAIVELGGGLAQFWAGIVVGAMISICQSLRKNMQYCAYDYLL